MAQCSASPEHMKQNNAVPIAYTKNVIQNTVIHSERSLKKKQNNIFGFLGKFKEISFYYEN